MSLVILAVYWLRVGRKEKVNIIWQLLIGGLLALLLSTIASHVYYDTRPFVTEHVVPIIAHAADNGFPSDHTLLTAFIGFTIYLHSRAVGGVLLLVALLVGIARVAAHIHHPIDIVGSFVIAAISVAIVQLLARRWSALSTARSRS
ncbi:MAG TPA: phosphatase PAP2 family protein [Acidimicrobiales bacterium]